MPDEQSAYRRFGVYLCKTDEGYCFDMPAEDLADRKGVMIGTVVNLEGIGLLLDRKVTGFEVVGGQSRSFEFAHTFLLMASLGLAGYFTWDLYQTDLGVCSATLSSDLGITQPTPATAEKP